MIKIKMFGKVSIQNPETLGYVPILSFIINKFFFSNELMKGILHALNMYCHNNYINKILCFYFCYPRGQASRAM